MLADKHLSLRTLVKTYPVSLTLTWLLVLAENALIIFIPLFVGYSIDSLLAGSYQDFWTLGALLVAIIVLAVCRRLYDTRVYGTIKVDLGIEVSARLKDLAVSARTARLDMSRELVDFLEHELPPLMTAIIQVVASVAILASFHWKLGASALTTGVLILVIYGLCHSRFVRLNATLNHHRERQVSILELASLGTIRRYLEKLRSREVKLSDTEALVYGGFFIMLFGFILLNLWLAATSGDYSAGSIFSIVTYSMELLESIITLPIVLQSLSRLSEIKQRINPDSKQP